jgi:hypothetical protein
MRRNQPFLTAYIVSILLALSPFVHAQDGEYLLNNFTPGISGADNLNFDITFDGNGMMYVANKNGILKFDGNYWDFEPMPSSVFSISIGAENAVYLGTRNGLGVLSETSQKRTTYTALIEDSSSVNIFKTLISGTRLYALNEYALFIYDLENKTFKKHPFRNSDTPLNIWEFERQIYIQSTNGGIRAVKNDELTDVEHHFPEEGYILFAKPIPGKEQYLIGTTKNQLFIWESNSYELLTLEDFDLANVVLTNGLVVDRSTAVLSTELDGCIFINLESGAVIEEVNYSTGLPDNEVYEIEIDPNLGVWVVQEYGFTRIAYNLPAKSFEHYPGLNGNLLAVQEVDGKLYVTTSTGLFFLKEKRNYRERVHYVPKTNKRKNEKYVQKPEDPVVEETQAVSGKRKKGIFGFLKKKDPPTSKEKVSVEARAEETKSENKDLPKVKDANERSGFFGFIRRKEPKKQEKKELKQYVRRVYRELESVGYEFEKIQGIHAKCRQLVPFRDRLLVSTNRGLYELIDTSAVLISSLEARYIFKPPESDNLIIANELNEIHSLRLFNNVWEEYPLIPGFNAYIEHINEDLNQNLWLAGSENVYKVAFFNFDSTSIETFSIDNEYSDPVFIVNGKEHTFFVHAGAYYYYDEASNTVKKNEEVMEKYGKAQRYFLDLDQNFWWHAKDRWSTLDDRVNKSLLDYLNLFSNINYLYYDPSENKIWVISDNKNLYRFDYENIEEYVSNNKLFLKKIENKTGNNLPLRKLTVKQENSFLTFEFSHPDYLGLLGLEYQYFLEGLNKEWSKWSSNNRLSFHYLPPGGYTLKVRTRNAFGQISEGKPYSFRVVPPFWQQWWFYLSEIAFFGLLLFLSFRLNRIEGKYNLLTKLLTIFTLVLILEFMETIVEAYINIQSSPVIDFAIEVSIALLILPVERVYRKYVISQENKIAAS